MLFDVRASSIQRRRRGDGSLGPGNLHAVHDAFGTAPFPNFDPDRASTERLEITQEPKRPYHLITLAKPADGSLLSENSRR